MGTSEQPPITCCLSAGDYQHHIAWIEGLTREALQTHKRDDLVLRLVYAPEAAREVQKVVELERICCAFLTFDLLERSDAVCVTITAPETAGSTRRPAPAISAREERRASKSNARLAALAKPLSARPWRARPLFGDSATNLPQAANDSFEIDQRALIERGARSW